VGVFPTTSPAIGLDGPRFPADLHGKVVLSEGACSSQKWPMDDPQSGHHLEKTLQNPSHQTSSNYIKLSFPVPEAQPFEFLAIMKALKEFVASDGC